ncbi:MAG: hypothetical protein KC449_01055 [Anaerolineales bacterium]|nr:hypothetical protein [Anaerolineales bacterium]
MRRKETFTFRVNDRERQLIERLSNQLKRNQSDAVRFVVIEAAEALTSNAEQLVTHDAVNS